MEQLELPFDDLLAAAMESALAGPRILWGVPVGTDGTAYEDDREPAAFEVVDEVTVIIKCTFFDFSFTTTISDVDLYMCSEQLCRAHLDNGPFTVTSGVTLSVDFTLTAAADLILKYFK